MDDLARAHHAIYLASQQSDSGVNSPAELPWERLPEVYKQSSRRFADHINAKMRASGLRLRPSQLPGHSNSPLRRSKGLRSASTGAGSSNIACRGGNAVINATTAGSCIHTSSTGPIFPNILAN